MSCNLLEVGILDGDGDGARLLLPFFTSSDTCSASLSMRSSKNVQLVDFPNVLAQEQDCCPLREEVWRQSIETVKTWRERCWTSAAG